MGITADNKGAYEVDGPDPEDENSHSVRVERDKDEAKAREKAAEARATAAAAEAEADEITRADHAQTIETSDPSNPQDAFGAVAGVEGGEKPATMSEAEKQAKEDAKNSDGDQVVESSAPPATGIDGEAQQAPNAQDDGAKAEAGSGMKSGDDPKDFGAPEVREHMQRSGDKERKRIIKAEKEGKGRKTIVDWKPSDS